MKYYLALMTAVAFAYLVGPLGHMDHRHMAHLGEVIGAKIRTAPTIRVD